MRINHLPMSPAHSAQFCYVVIVYAAQFIVVRTTDI